MEGLVHQTEITWDRIKHPSQRFQIGDRITTRVLEADLENRRISLSTKALEKNPFEQVAEKFPAGAVLQVKVKSLTDFGAFVEIDQSVDGMVHIGELSWTEHVSHPSEVLTIGEEIEVVVLKVDANKQRVSCSIKQLTENPWARWEKEYARGTRHELKITRLIEQGAFFDLGDGLAAFCPRRDLSTENVGRVKDVVKVGDVLELEVRLFDRRQRRVTVSARAVVEGVNLLDIVCNARQLMAGLMEPSARTGITQPRPDRAIVEHSNCIV